MRNSSASQSIQLVNVLEVDIIYGTAVNNMHDSTIVAVHKMIVFTCNCHCSYSASYQKSYLEAFIRTESKNISVSSMNGKKTPLCSHEYS